MYANKNILNTIITNKITWIQEQKKFISLEKIKNSVKKTKLNFYKSLKKNYNVFILECKKASPAQGIICKNFNIIKIVNVYKNYASAISVITDEKFFQGNFNFIQKIKKLVLQPILCKDFIIDPYQIYFARYYGADAILLILSIINDYEYNILSNIAHRLNMGVLTEVNNKNELKRAINLNAKIISINNRNLKDFSVNVNHTFNILKKQILPKDIILISASGIHNNKQIRDLSKFVHGFLIGSAITSQQNILAKVKSLIFGKNKICGLKNVKEAEVTSKYGGFFGGLIFTTKSIRFITLANALKITSYVKTLFYVGVFYNSTIAEIIKISKSLSLYAVQLHGDEDQNFINILRKKLSKKTKIWKVIKISNHIPKINFYNIDLYVYDNYLPGKGLSFNWKLLKKKKTNNILLAGGLNIENCIKAINLNCYGLDFNSGIENTLGTKDLKKIKDIFQKLRNYRMIRN
ncbi:bifunctional indole-3-glycerol-phosphate synthase TrpC/phosphoribosylanthranilate isomerase TrpF [Enterobacteriaceae endosymbiont of Donacia tomentosa]|uniref:bifunctional indole-3-glycerol-phosphate synthase TrpC/phosphoribosylanthranilate isomerase TrpF n=1 Tax=Enterobacteriaceae endosymbiont of Donacia tomentosa TaxID=2675787 RepID=UPI001449A036|nr:bifunctional indole-3-glycerol-phosphate synthase TrpC/phosphoribosylanthranilate isomerase TrpF [Enterobacteriaceae endosymbiont of Donacia tomentosa]QJC31550.1 bifunctional indole-3-glycerol-phosphate synthase TrpC/phosphoribosylanthranilate isomerase TrpF [Enterobacteriaceae endosymbiont of Donacia tomentosa]